MLPGKNPGPVTRGRLLTQQPTPPEVPAGLPSSLLERRSDVQAAEQILVSANANIGVAKAACFPTITLTSEFGFQSTALASLFWGSRRIWSFVPQITQPIFTAGRIPSQVEFAEAHAKRAGAIRKGHSSCIPRCLRRADSIPKRERGPRLARVAGDGVAGSKAPGLPQISGRRRHDAQRSQFGSGSVCC